MRVLLFVLAVLPSLAFADGETLYLRAAADCPTNGDGTAFACATSGGGVGAWSNLTGFNGTDRVAASDTAGKIDAGDTLCIIGDIVGQMTYGGAALLGSGSSGSEVTFDFNCSEGAGCMKPQEANNYGFYSEQNWLILNEPCGSGPAGGPTNLGNIFYFPDAQSTDRNIVVNGGIIDNCQIKTGESCIHFNGDNNTVDGLRCDDAEQYCVLFNGTNNTVRNSASYQNGGGGSCFLWDAETDNGLAEHNTCVKAGAGGACYEINDQSPAAVTAPTLIGNNCYALASGTSRGYLLKGAANVYGGIIENTNTAFEVATGAGGQPGTVRIIGVTSYNAAQQHVYIGNTWDDVQVMFNTFDTGPEGIDSDDDSVNNIFRNNIIVNMTVGIAEITGTLNVEEYNSFFGNTDNRTVNAVGAGIDGTDITTDPQLSAARQIDQDSPAWGAGTVATPWYGTKAQCSGSTVNIGASCAVQAAPRFRVAAD